MLTFRFGAAARTPLEQLQNAAKASKFYDEDVLSTLSNNEQKVNYLQMLASANSLALDNRLGRDYSDISDSMTKYWKLETEYQITLLENALKNEEYQAQMQEAFDKNIDEKFAADSKITDNAAISSIVKNKYNGSYSQFMKDYESADQVLSDDYLAFAEEYDEDSTREVFGYMQESSAMSSQQAELERLYKRRDEINQAIVLDRVERLRKKAYEDASFMAKAGSSVLQILAAPITEIGNVLEGIIDAAALTSATIADGLKIGNISDDVQQFVSDDIIPLDVLLADILPASYITSPYAEDNAFKWIYEVETSIIYMTPMAINLIPGCQGLGTFLYYTSSSGRTGEGYILDNKDPVTGQVDVSFGNIVAYTTATTAIEVFTEKINTDAIFGNGIFDKWIKTGNSKFKTTLQAGYDWLDGSKVTKLIKQAAGEGFEEIASEIGSQIVGSILTGENKFDGDQILRAGALGAATGMIIEASSNEMFTRRALGIGLNITDSKGNYVTLSEKDSMIVEKFMADSKQKLDAGKTLSKRDQRIYDHLSKLDFRDTVVSRKNYRRIAGTKYATYDVQYPKQGTIEAEEAWLKSKLEERKTQQGVGTGKYKVPEWVREEYLAQDVDRLQSIYNQLVEKVESGEDYKDLQEEIIPERAVNAMRTEVSQMATVWNNSLLKANENSQAVLTAVNDYYNDTLDRIVSELDYPVLENATKLNTLQSALGIKARLTKGDTSNQSLYKTFVGSVSRVYPQFKGKINTYTTDSKTSPIVSIIGNELYINHKFLRAMSIPSITKVIEMEVITDTLYESLSIPVKELTLKLAKENLGLGLLDGIYRSVQLQKQILYSALFVPGNDIAIQLSERSSADYAKLREILEERVKKDNIQIKNTAYRGMFVYDTTILKRMSVDEALEKRLLTENYSIEDLLSATGGPDADRFTFKYGINASLAGIKVMSAIRHLQTNFGLQTTNDNFYQTLLDIKNPEKYKNMDNFQKVLNRYSNTEVNEFDAIPTDQAINKYLRDQFNFEIDALGTIVATEDIEKIVDEHKLLAALKAAKPVMLHQILTEQGKSVVAEDCLISIVDVDDWNKRGYDRRAVGQTSKSATGVSLIEVRINGENPKTGNTYTIDDAYETVVHEIQHYFTNAAHLPTGIYAVLSAANINAVRSNANTNEFDAAIRAFVNSHKQPDSLFDANTADISEVIEYARDLIYAQFDVDESYSDFKQNVRLVHSIDSTVISNVGAQTISTIEIPKNHKLDKIDYEFLKYFDGKSFIFAPSDKTINDKIGKILGGKTTLDEFLKAGLSSEPTLQEQEPTLQEQEPTQSRAGEILSKFRQFAFGDNIPDDSDLCSPQFLAEHAVSEELKLRFLSMTPDDCKRLIQRNTKMVFDEYSGTFVEPGKTAKYSEYIKHIGKESIVIRRPDTTIIQLPRDYAIGKYPELDTALAGIPTDEVDTAKYYIDDRIFANKSAALQYVNAEYASASENIKNSSNPAAIARFDSLIDKMVPNGFRHENDFAFVTNDGKVYSYKTDGKPGEFFKKLCEHQKINHRLITNGLQVNQETGEFEGTLESGNAKLLFNGKKIVRLYYIDGQWQAYGQPNYLQDAIIRQAGATALNRSYILPEDDNFNDYIPETTKLVVNDEGKVAIDRTGQTNFKEVSWKNSTWYQPICDIIEKYNINKLSELKDLGFNREFIEILSQNYGRAIQSKTAGKLGLSEGIIDNSRKYSGIAQNAITEFINDNAASSFARNLLIQNAPARASTDNLNWSTCAHIRTVEDASDYLRTIIAYSGTLERLKNHEKFDSLNDLIVFCKKNYIAGDENKSILAYALQNTRKDERGRTISDRVDFTNYITAFLNRDALQEGKAGRLALLENLDYSLDGFNAAAMKIASGQAAPTTDIESRSGVISAETEAQGRHADETGDLNIIDVQKGTQDKMLEYRPDTATESAEDQQIADWLNRQIAKANKLDDTKRQQAFEQIKNRLVRYNQKSIDEIGEPDKFIIKLIAHVDNLMSTQVEQQTKVQAGVQKVIDDATKRIDKSEDKLKAQGTEYQLITANRGRLISQFGETGYKQLLEALSREAIIGEGHGTRNVDSNISKRLASTGSASIEARIDKLFEGPTASKFKSLLNTLNKVREVFKGVKYGTANATDMRFKFSELLTQYYKFLDNFAKTGKAQEFAKVKSTYSEIADYLDNLVLSGNYDFQKAYPEHGVYAEWAQQLIDGNLQEPGLDALNSLSLNDRLEQLKNWIIGAENNNYPEPVVDRMRAIAESVIPEQEPSFARDTKPKKPKIDTSILTWAQNAGGLSTDVSKTLSDAVTKINEKAAERGKTKHERAQITKEARAIKQATFDAVYMQRTLDRLNRETREYLKSPKLTIEDAKLLVMHAAEMIEGFDYQTKIDAFRKRANETWKNDESPHIVKNKKILKEGRKGGYDSWEIEAAQRSRARYLTQKLDEYRAAKNHYRFANTIDLQDNTNQDASSWNTWADDHTPVVELARIIIRLDTLGKPLPQYIRKYFDGLSYNAIIKGAEYFRNTYLDSVQNNIPINYDKLSKMAYDFSANGGTRDKKFDKSKVKEFEMSTTLLSEMPKTVNEVLELFSILEIPKTIEPDEFTEFYTKHSSFETFIETYQKAAKRNALTKDTVDKNGKKKPAEIEKINGIINGIYQALLEFEYRPMTITSGLKFLTDIRTVLADGKLNKSLFGWKDVPIYKLKRVGFNPLENESSVDTLLRLVQVLKTGKYTNKFDIIDKELKQGESELSGAINSIVETIKSITIGENDVSVKSDVSQQMRYEADDINELDFTEEENLDINELDFVEDIPEQNPSYSLKDQDFEFVDSDEYEDLDFEDTDEPEDKPTDKPKKSDTKSKKSDTKPKKSGDQRPIDEQFRETSGGESISSRKTIQSELLTRNNVDIRTMLLYEFQKTRNFEVMGQVSEKHNISSQEFSNNPTVARIFSQLANNENAIIDFVDWCKEATSIEPDVKYKAAILLNKLAVVPGLKFDIVRKIEAVRKEWQSQAGTLLALGNKHGLNAIEEVQALAMQMFELGEDDIKRMKQISKAHDEALDNNDYKAAEQAMVDALEIFKEHQKELDDSINPFVDIESLPEYKAAVKELQNAKTETEITAAREKVRTLRIKLKDEQAIRWKNLSNKISAWRYFAMLSTPATFWAKNYAGNAVAKSFNAVSTRLAGMLQDKIEKRRPGMYTRTNKQASQSVIDGVNRQLVNNGLIDSILSGAVTKYDTGYRYAPSAIRNITKSLSKGEELDSTAQASLVQLLNARTPFGEKNPVAKALNKYYNVIFDTMNKVDQQFVRGDIIRLTTQLVTDNMSANEVAELNGTMSDTTKAKFEGFVSYAQEEALKTYFRSTPKVYNTLMSLFKDHPIAQTIFSVICPFPRMVINTTLTALAYSPIGFIQAAMTLRSDESMFANITASQQLAKASVGSVAMLIGAMLAALGALDIDEDDPYAGPQLVIFDKLRISLEGLEPSATPFIVGSMFVLGPKTDGEANAFTAAANALLDTTVLGEIMNQFGQGKTETEWIGSTFSSFVTQFIPTVLKRATQLVDPGKKNYSGDFSSLKRIAATIPGLSFLIDDKIDPYTGDAKVQHTDSTNQWTSRFLVLLNAITPTKITWSNPSDLEVESKAVGAATTGPAKTITIDGVNYTLTNKQYEEYKILRAKLYSQYANDLIKTEAYKKLSIEKRKSKLKQLQSKATQAARTQLNIP